VGRRQPDARVVALEQAEVCAICSVHAENKQPRTFVRALVTLADSVCLYLAGHWALC
jgi:hypothetical protein